MQETAQTQRAALSGALTAHLAELRMEPEESRVHVGGRAVGDSDLVAFRAQLSSALYELWHAGTAGRDTDAVGYHRDEAFERELTAAAPQRTTATPVVLRALADDSHPEHAIVEVNRVRLLVPAESVPTGQQGDALVLDLPAVRPMLSPGFLFATGTAGGGGGPAVLRLYVHLETPEHAPTVWHTVLDALESRGARYRAKVLSRRTSYPRRDAIVVYLPEESRRHVPDLARVLEGLPGLGTSAPVLARPVRPGLTMAWEPADQRLGWQRMSFGQHRTMAVAHGVVRHMSDGVPLHQAVTEELTAAGVDPADPARNLDSPAFPGTVGLTAVPA